MMQVLALTLFPEMFPGPLGHSLAGRALDEGLWSLQTLNIRDFAEDKHKTVDAPPYGGGTGMVMRADVLAKAINHAKMLLPGATLIYFTPRGERLTQGLIHDILSRSKKKSEPSAHEAVPHVSGDSRAAGALILICGRFEGVDQRVLDHYAPLEISVGDYILSGGEVAALTFLDACVRLIPGVIGKESALHEESFSAPVKGWGQVAPIPPGSRRPASRGNNQIEERFDCATQSCALSANLSKNNEKNTRNSACLLEYPLYTRPPEWMGRAVPDVLLSGNHAEISRWRAEQRETVTKARRPDLWNIYLNEKE